MKFNQKNISILAACLSTASAQAQTTVFFQDFSASNPINSVGGATINEGVLIQQDGLSFTGGDAGAQATNGDYTYTLTQSNGAGAGNGFIINAPAGFVTAGYNGPSTGGVADFVPGAGIANIDEPSSLTTGIITFADGASGSVSINLANFNVGGEFLSINSVEVTEDAATLEVLLMLNINGFGDFLAGGSESIGLTTAFSGGEEGFDNLAFAGANSLEDSTIFQNEISFTTNNDGFDDTQFTFVLREAVPEPSSTALLGLAGLGLLGRRRRK